MENINIKQPQNLIKYSLIQYLKTTEIVINIKVF